MGRGSPPASGRRRCRRRKLPGGCSWTSRRFVAPSLQQSAPVTGVAAARPRPVGVTRGGVQIEQWLRQDRRLRRSGFAGCCCRWPGPVAARTGAPVCRRAAGGRAPRLRAPQRACRHDDGGRLRRIVGRHRWGAVQGQVPGARRCLTADVYFAKAYPLERLESLLDRHRIGVRVFRRRHRCGA